MGAVYDLFGNGKTALKLSLGKYMQAYSVIGGDDDMNPIARIATSYDPVVDRHRTTELLRAELRSHEPPRERRLRADGESRTSGRT